jgi:hypothetical protein
MHLYLFFLQIAQHNIDPHNTHTLTLMKAQRKSYPYEHLRRLDWQILEIEEVIIGALLSTGTLPTTKSTTQLNPKKFAPTRSPTQNLSYY